MSPTYPHVLKDGKLAVKVGNQWRIGGSRAWRNMNCGNLRYVGQPAALGRDEKNFAVFPTYQDGYNALKNMVLNAANGRSRVYRPDMNLYAFFSVYAPAADSNDPGHYARVVARAMNVDPETFRLRDLL